MLVIFVRFAGITEIKVGTNTACVANALNWSNFATCTLYALMDSQCLFDSFSTQVIGGKSVEGLGSVGSDFFPECFFEFLDQSIVLLPSSIASLAGVASPVDLSSVASQALNPVVFFNRLFPLLKGWPWDLGLLSDIFFKVG